MSQISSGSGSVRAKMKINKNHKKMFDKKYSIETAIEKEYENSIEDSI